MLTISSNCSSQVLFYLNSLALVGRTRVQQRCTRYSNLEEPTHELCKLERIQMLSNSPLSTVCDSEAAGVLEQKKNLLCVTPAYVTFHEEGYLMQSRTPEHEKEST